MNKIFRNRCFGKDSKGIDKKLKIDLDKSDY